MAFIKYLVAALTVGVAVAQDDCSADPTLTVSAASAASSVASCNSFTGSVEFVKGAASGGKLDLGSLKKVSGDITYFEDDSVETISAGSLQTVGGLNLTNLARLSALSMGSLSQVSGNLTLMGLGGLQTFDFGQGIKKAGGVTIINTQITSLDGINQASEIDGLEVSDNKFLTQIGLNVSKVGSISIGPNNVAQGQRAMFPNLKTGDFLSFRNCTEVSVPSLSSVSTLLGLYGNYFTSFAASNLTSSGAVVVVSNSKLTNVSFPKLTKVNGSRDNARLVIANNTELKNVTGFAKLESVEGDVSIRGEMDVIDLPALKTISGALNVKTSSKEFKCDDINKLQDDQVARGEVNCDANSEDPNSGSSEDGGDDSGDNSDSAAASLAMPAGLLLGALAFLALM